MEQAIRDLLIPEKTVIGINLLSSLSGISLVIASKIYRFCCPTLGASVDRHASYFFNSLPVTGKQKSTAFHREWANGNHTSSRLAIYSDHGFKRNRNEYFANYLPLLKCISDSLNSLPALYLCAATDKKKNGIQLMLRWRRIIGGHAMAQDK